MSFDIAHERDIIIEPLISEKSMLGISDLKYCFKVKKMRVKLKFVMQSKEFLKLKFQK